MVEKSDSDYDQIYDSNMSHKKLKKVKIPEVLLIFFTLEVAISAQPITAADLVLCYKIRSSDWLRRK
jgi:hypothetical protein